MEKKLYLKPDTETLLLTESEFLCVSGGDLAEQGTEYELDPDMGDHDASEIWGNH